jgi:hypothetical protein
VEPKPLFKKWSKIVNIVIIKKEEFGSTFPKGGKGGIKGGFCQ